MLSFHSLPADSADVSFLSFSVKWTRQHRVVKSGGNGLSGRHIYGLVNCSLV